MCVKIWFCDVRFYNNFHFLFMLTIRVLEATGIPSGPKTSEYCPAVEFRCRDNNEIRRSRAVDSPHKPFWNQVIKMPVPSINDIKLDILIVDANPIVDSQDVLKQTSMEFSGECKDTKDLWIDFGDDCKLHLKMQNSDSLREKSSGGIGSQGPESIPTLVGGPQADPFRAPVHRWERSMANIRELNHNGDRARRRMLGFFDWGNPGLGPHDQFRERIRNLRRVRYERRQRDQEEERGVENAAAEDEEAGDWDGHPLLFEVASDSEGINGGRNSDSSQFDIAEISSRSETENSQSDVSERPPLS